MQSARTKQLLILGNRKNRTNDLLRELSTRRSWDPELCQLSTTVHAQKGSSAFRAHQQTRTRKRLKAVSAKVDTGLRRRRLFATQEVSVQSPVLAFEELQVAKVTPQVAEKGDFRFDKLASIDDEGESEEDVSIAPRIRIRRKCAREARQALEILRTRPLCPNSIEKFRVALETMRAQRALIEPSLLQKLETCVDDTNDSDDQELLADSEPEIDTVEESYDPNEQLSEEFVTVWGAVAHESKELLKRAGTSMKIVEKHLLEHYSAIRNIFKYYSSITKPFDENITAAELGSMTLSDWMTFCRDCKLIGAHPKLQLVKSSAELLFIRLNWVTDDRGRKVKNQDASNSDRSLIMPEFLCGILRLAKQCGERMENLGLTASQFVQNVVCKRAHSVDVEQFRTRMRFRSAQAAIQDFQTEISTTFTKYAAAEANDRVGAGLSTMDLKELMSLCRRLEIVGSVDTEHLLPPLAVQHAFALSQLQVIGDDAGEIDEDEFVELISRIAESFFDRYFAAVNSAIERDRSDVDTAAGPGGADSIRPRVPCHDITLAWKLRWFFPRLNMTQR